MAAPDDLLVRALFRPITRLLTGEDVTEIVMNGYGSLFLEQGGRWHNLKEHTALVTKDKIEPAFNTASAWNQGILSYKHPLLSGSIPEDPERGLPELRIEAVIPPAVDEHSFAIRKPGIRQMTLEDFDASGAFDHVHSVIEKTEVRAEKPREKIEQCLAMLKAEPRNLVRFFKQCVQNRLTTVISGGTGTGKTTFFNALAREIDDGHRIITIEDTREIKLRQDNKVHLVTQRAGASYDFTDLLRTCLRLRPTRIMAAELRGAEAFAFLRSINTGHPGSMTTLHANDCAGAIMQLMLMLSEAKSGLPIETLKRYIEASVDMIVQLSFGPNGRYISEIRIANQTVMAAGAQ